jgi:hypothetical protein
MKVLREVFTLEFCGAIIGMVLGIQLGIAAISLGVSNDNPSAPLTYHSGIREAY